MTAAAMTAIPAEGRVDLRLYWDGDAVLHAEVLSRRPQPQRLLHGKPLAYAREVIPQLYSLCGDAQTVSAEALSRLIDEGGFEPAQTRGWAERIRLENIREHLWRLGLDWPRVAGEEPRPEPLRELLAARGRFVDDRESAGAWAETTALGLFGKASAPWLGPSGAEPFHAWLREGPTPLAGLLGRLRPRLTGLGQSALPLFRSADLAPLGRDIQARIPGDADFHQRPDWQGQVFEMGPLARHQEHPLFTAISTEQRGADAWFRLVARVLELALGLESLRVGEPARPIVFGQAAGDQAIVALEMARGVLLHWAEVEQGSVRDYRIVAPTEWNFHPLGPAAQGLSRLRAGSESDLRERVALLVMALDPCVHYELEIVDA